MSTRASRSVFAVTAAAAALLAIGGCSDDSSSSSTSGATKPAAVAASGDNYCDSYATMVKQTLDRMNSINMTSASGVASAQAAATSAAAEAEVTGTQLMDMAPNDVKALWKQMEAANQSGNTDAIEDIPGKINSWALANCPAKYKSVLDEYQKIVG
ncbi:hypothetical protein [Gordonia jacobaea]|uniref:hypothetical protein n=1 Tax=Gordonia jacobaea TaxID=122202 RepID=UPI003D7126F6